MVTVISAADVRWRDGFMAKMRFTVPMSDRGITANPARTPAGGGGGRGCDELG